MADPVSQLEVEIRAPTVTRTLTMSEIRAWVEGKTKSPREKITVEDAPRFIARNVGAATPTV